ncbi:MAG: branched-chain amino acid ABC transporter permease [Oscillospiraceae bacterium]|nr:branched-chain amino acid ABC transporter permease [bacterium]MDY5100359.1 branched-chain amino acid ABC transporter permease [Oscillospiraceae bacterium]
MKTKEEKRDSWIAMGLLAGFYVLLLVVEMVVPPTHMLFSILKKSAVYSLAAVSMNLLNGFTGLFSLGQAGFMLMGAYTYAILTMPVELKMGDSVYKYYDCIVHFQTGMIPGLLMAGLVAALMAALIGIPVLRLKSDYLGIATLGFAEIIRAMFQWDALGPLTNGANILSGFIDLNHVYFPFTQVKIPPTFFVFLLSGGCIAVIVLLINSSYGRAFKAIRDDETAAEAMGINLFHYKELSFVISSFFAGISGALLAMYQFTVKAAPFKTSMTYEILLIVVIGGIGSITGSCIGSFLFIACNEWWLRFLDDASNNILGLNILRSGFRKVVFSVVIMVIVLFFSRGLMGDREFSVKRIRKRWEKLRRRGKDAAKGGGEA